jgi:RNA polymerase sigma-70 factor (ECF subfamily)
MTRRHVSSLSDREIVQAWLESSDAELFRELYDRHKRRVYAISQAILKDNDAASDVTQEVFCRAYEALPRFRNENFEGWLAQIARNLSLRELDKRIRRQETHLGNALGVPLDAEFVTRPDVQEVLELVPERQRRAIKLIDAQGYSYREAASICGVTESEMRSALQYGRQRFRQLWHEGVRRRQ